MTAFNEAFPEICILGRGGDYIGSFKYFAIGAPGIDSAMQTARNTLIELGKNPIFSESQAQEVHDLIVRRAAKVLAVAITHCNECPVKERNVCRGMKKTDLTRSVDDYKARLTVHGLHNQSNITAKDQMAGARCGVTAEQLDNIQWVKL